MRERAERLQKALEQVPKVEAQKKSSQKEKARASTTDPEAQVMKMADGGFAKKDDITRVSLPAGKTRVYAPVQQAKKDDLDPHTPRDGDSPAVAEWRTRMATDQAKEIYKERAATAECVNAIARNHGLQQARIRGRPKVLAVILWYVLVHNLMRVVALRGQQGIEMN